MPDNIPMSLSHEAMWQAIDLLAEHVSLSTSGLARKAGLDPTAFNRSKRISPEGKPRWPSTESISKILSVTGISITDFMTFVDTREIYVMQPRSLRPMPHLPLIEAASKEHFNDKGHPIGAKWDAININHITPLSETDYTLEVQGDDLQPLYRDGSILIISPSYDIRRQDRVLLKTHSGALIVAEFIRKSAHKIELKGLSFSNMHQELVLPTTDVAWIARILWGSQ